MKPRFLLSRFALGYVALGVLALALFALPLWHLQLVERFWHGILGAFALVLLLGGVLAWRSRRLLAELNEIKQAEQRYALVMSASDDGFWDWKVAGDELYVSPRFLEMFDFPPDTTFAGRAAMFKRLSIPAADREAVERAVAEHFAGKTARMEIEFRALVRGEERWMRAIGRATRDASGAVSRWNGAIRDVTARRRAEEALRRSEGRYARVLEASNEALWEWNPLTDEMFMSERARHLWAVPDGAVVRTRAELKKLGRFHPEDLQRTEDGVAASRGPGARGLVLEYRVIGADGEVRWLRSQGKMFFDERDAPARMTGSLTDITERKLADLALAESEARFRSLTELSNDFFWETDAEHRYTVIELGRAYAGVRNNASKLGLARWEIPYASPDEAAWAAHRAAIAARERFVEFRFSRIEEGEERFYEHSGEPHYDAQGNFRGYRGVGRDVTARKRAEEALRRSEERYSLAMDASEEGHFDVNLDTDEHFTSERLNEIHGFRPGTRTAKRSEFIKHVRFHRDDAEKYYAAIAAAEAKDGPERYECEFRIVRPSGEVRWLRTRGKVTRDAEGRACRRTGVVADVTARKLAEEALRASEERYSLAMEASEEGHFDLNIETGEIFIAERLNEIYGFAPGTRFANRDEYLAQVRLHGEDVEKYHAVLDAAVARQGPERYELEFRIVRPSGEVRWLRTRGKVTRDAEGRACRRTDVVADITARKLAEEALRESEQRYELAMAASESGYWDWHVPTNRYFSSARAHELSGFPGETRWLTRDEYRANINMHPEDFARWEAAREALFAGTGERLAMEVRYMVRGEARWHNLQGICLRDDTGKVVRWAGSATDITERKLAEEALRRSESKLRLAQRLEAMGTLAGGIAHDFNNILGAVLGYGELALRDAPKGSRLARDLDSIMIAGERGRSLVERLLAFSRSAVGERVPVHVERVVREALDLVSAKLLPSVTVHAKLHAGPAAVLGDATQVHQVVANLAINAIQAMPAGGTLRVELAIERVEAPRAATIGGRGAGEYVVLTVADTGAGIAPEIVDRIFDPFFTTKEVGTGTGLGLSLVNGIVTELGGAIDVASTLGTGSTFTVYLPRSGDAAEPGDEKESALPRGDGQRVLIVDDEEPLVQLATRTLADLGYVPIGFTSSAAALAAFRADPERFDALIADERMPEMSGSALIREVRGMRSAMPIVLMSGYLGAAAGKARESGLVDTPGVASKAALAIGADEVLQKPLSARDLATSLARVLRL